MLFYTGMTLKDAGKCGRAIPSKIGKEQESEQGPEEKRAGHSSH